MTKKKKFVISQNLQRGMVDTVNAVGSHPLDARFEIIALTRIEVDPNNPRELAISKEEIQNGIQKEDSLKKIKEEELERLSSLAQTINQKGLINPVVVYKYGDVYRLVAGERRFLASWLAKKENIHAKILEEKPKSFDLRLLQWIENTEREDLSLKDRIANIDAIVGEYKKEHSNIEINATLIKEIIGISLPQATYYLAILNAPDDVREQINNGNINNLDKVATIAKIKSNELRQKLIEACKNGANLKQIQLLIQQEKFDSKKVENGEGLKKQGRALKGIKLGETKKPSVVRKIIFAFLNQPTYKKYLNQFTSINWEEHEHVKRAFKTLIGILEGE